MAADGKVVAMPRCRCPKCIGACEIVGFAGVAASPRIMEAEGVRKTANVNLSRLGRSRRRLPSSQERHGWCW